MRIAISIYGFPPVQVAGAENAIMKLAETLSKKGHEVHIVTRKTAQTPSYEKTDGFFVHRFRVFGKHRSLPIKPTQSELYQCALNQIPLLCRVVRRYNIELIHANFIVPTGLGCVAVSKMTHVPMILTVHGGDIFIPSKITNPLRRCVLRNAEIVTCPSEDLVNEIARIGGLSHSQVAIVPNGVDTEIFRPTENISKVSNSFTILYVGRLIPRKGVEYLIRAVPELLMRQKPVNVIICGDGPERARLRKLCDSLEISHIVKFTGFVSSKELPSLYRSCDIFVNPSLWEAGISLTMLEAMATGRPVIACNTTGARAIGGTGNLLVELRNPKALAEGILKLAERDDQRELIGWQNRELVEKKFSWFSIADRYSKLYRLAAKR